MTTSAFNLTRGFRLACDYRVDTIDEDSCDNHWDNKAYIMVPNGIDGTMELALVSNLLESVLFKLPANKDSGT